METVQPESVGISSDRLGRLSAWLDQQVESQRLAGASVLVGRHDQHAFFRAAGAATPERRFASDTLARIYSMTKPVTAVAAMMLYERGAFQLDDPVAWYLPEFERVEVWRGGGPLDHTEPAAAPITVQQLLTHTAGLTYGFMQANLVDAEYRRLDLGFPSALPDLAAWCRTLAGVPLLCQPGSQWNYSVASDVLGRLVEVWSGSSLPAFFRDEIFAPLDMRDTGFQVPVGERGRFADLYAPKSGASLAGIGVTRGAERAPPAAGFKLEEAAASSPYHEAPRLPSGGGGLVGTIGDYARFCRMLLGGGALDGVRLLSPKTVAHMRRNHLPGNRDMAAMGQPVWSETSYDGIGFGLGFAVVLDPVKASIVTSAGEHHWGGAASTFFWLDPVESLYVVFFTQLIPSSTYPIRRELRVRVYQSLIG